MSLTDRIRQMSPSMLWGLDSAASSEPDLSGNGRNGSIINSITRQYNKTTKDGTYSGTRANPSNGSNAIASAASDDWSAGQPMSLVAWVRRNAAPSGAGQLVGRYTQGSGGAGVFYMDATGAIVWYIFGSAEYYGVFQDPSNSTTQYVLPLSVPTMLAVTMDTSNVCRTYVDGAPCSQHVYNPGDLGVLATPTVVNARNNNTTALNVGGKSGTTFPWTNDVTYGPAATWASVLSAADVAALYRESLRGGVMGGGYG